jgi:hypothetical protein
MEVFGILDTGLARRLKWPEIHETVESESNSLMNVWNKR